MFLDPVYYLESTQDGHSCSYSYLDYKILQEPDEFSRATLQKCAKAHYIYKSVKNFIEFHEHFREGLWSLCQECLA